MGLDSHFNTWRKYLLRFLEVIVSLKNYQVQKEPFVMKIDDSDELLWGLSKFWIINCENWCTLLTIRYIYIILREQYNLVIKILKSGLSNVRVKIEHILFNYVQLVEIITQNMRSFMREYRVIFLIRFHVYF